MINNDLVLVNNQQHVIDVLSLESFFFNTNIVQHNGIDPILMGLAKSKQQEVDLLVVNTLQNFLFPPSPGAPGLDLVALNIQRGRDHGLPDYNTARINFTNTVALDWAGITSNTSTQTRLRQAYGNNLNDVDLWVGLLAEDHLSGTSTGKTLHAILKDQFEKLRDGDRFYYAIEPIFEKDRAFWNDYISSTTLADIISRNTGLSSIPSQVFFAQGYTIAQKTTPSLDPAMSIDTPKKQLILISDKLVKVFPNPATSEVTVLLDLETAQTIHIRISNATGQELIRTSTSFLGGGSRHTIPISDLVAGVYFMEVWSEDGDEFITTKLVIK